MREHDLSKQEKVNLFVSVIVPVLNGEATIRECLDSLLRQEYPSDKYEIIVVDNGSADQTPLVVANFKTERIVLLQERTKRNSDAARNFGIRRARGDICAFIDADCVADKLWLKKLSAYFLDSIIGGIGGDILAHSPETMIEQYQEERNVFSLKVAQKGPWGFFPLTGNAAYRKDIFYDVGFFCDCLKAGAEYEFAKRCKVKTSYKIVSAADVIVYHHHCRQLSQLWAQRYRYGYGAAQLVSVDPSLRSLLRIESPFLYFIPGFLYFFMHWVQNLLIFLFKKRKIIFLVAAWLDFYGEIAFRFGYREGVSASKRESRYQFYNFPKRIEAEDYQEAKKRILEQWQSVKSVVAVLSFGSFASGGNKIDLGISDIDLLPVVHSPTSNEVERICDSRKKDLFYEDFFRNQEEAMVSKECFADADYLLFDPYGIYKHEQGEPVQREKISGEAQAFCSMAMILGHLPTMILRNSYYLDQKCVDIKGALNLLYSQRHNIARLRFLGIEMPACEKMIGEVAVLRKQWINLSDRERKQTLVRLLKENADIYKEIVLKVAHFMEQKNFIKSIEAKDQTVVLKLPGNTFLIFSDQAWARNNNNPILRTQNIRLPSFFPALWKEIMKLAHWNVVILPLPISSFFLIHSTFPGEFAKTLQDSFTGELYFKVQEENVPYREHFRIQSDVYRKYWNFLRENKLRTGVSSMINLFLVSKQPGDSFVQAMKTAVRETIENINYHRAIRLLISLGIVRKSEDVRARH